MRLPQISDAYATGLDALRKKREKPQPSSAYAGFCLKKRAGASAGRVSILIIAYPAGDTRDSSCPRSRFPNSVRYLSCRQEKRTPARPGANALVTVENAQ